MTITASKLRQNIYKVLDDVADKGIPVVINRKGKIIKIIAEKGQSRVSKLKKRNVMNCKPDEIVHMDWSSEWRK